MLTEQDSSHPYLREVESGRFYNQTPARIGPRYATAGLNTYSGYRSPLSFVAIR